ncbi:vanZ like family [Clostridium sp. CAG:762]|mgnify:CR=1 FL=1|nr:vanZ like family [Clostridium sp. CAG:762]
MREIFTGNSVINQFIQVIPITLLVGILYIIFRFLKLKKNNSDINYKREILYLIFICYIVGLFNLVLVPINFWNIIWYNIFYNFNENPFAGIFDFSYNFIPTIYKIIIGEYTLDSWGKVMIVGNFLMFIPMGILLSLCLENVNKKNIFKYAVLIPLAIEVLQLVVGRSFDIDDLVMNFLGIVIGYYLVKLIKKLKIFNKC